MFSAGVGCRIRTKVSSTIPVDDEMASGPRGDKRLGRPLRLGPCELGIADWMKSKWFLSPTQESTVKMGARSGDDRPSIGLLGHRLGDVHPQPAERPEEVAGGEEDEGQCHVEAA